HLFLSATHRAPHASTPFPYTTLFRSRGRRGGAGQDQHGRVRHGLVHGELGVRSDPQPVGHHAGTGWIRRWLVGVARGVRGTAGQDRKSTRLNSSHVKISYAVFCLKKK